MNSKFGNYKKIKPHKSAALFFGGNNRALYLLSKGPPDLSPEFFQPLASKFGTTFRALNYKKIKAHKMCLYFLVGTTGLEPVTLCL